MVRRTRSRRQLRHQCIQAFRMLGVRAVSYRWRALSCRGELMLSKVFSSSLRRHSPHLALLGWLFVFIVSSSFHCYLLMLVSCTRLSTIYLLAFVLGSRMYFCVLRCPFLFPIYRPLSPPLWFLLRSVPACSARLSLFASLHLSFLYFTSSCGIAVCVCVCMCVSVHVCV